VAVAVERSGRTAWERRIARARQLAGGRPAGALLEFYARLLAFQQELSARLAAHEAEVTTAAARDVDVAALGPFGVDLAGLVVAKGPPALAAEAKALLQDPAVAFDARLLGWWHAPSDRDFFAKALVQPWAARLADAGGPPLDRGLVRAANRCPFCAGAPQVSILDSPGEHGGGRSLLCATCFTSWPFRRVLCPSCGEEDERRLGYYQTDELPHLRLDVCDTCGRYLKSIDRTRDGLAVPLVDEVAGAPLDVWARERGYEKIELNLAGL
jgi:formate dehydrogenase maturation protein FdhE